MSVVAAPVIPAQAGIPLSERNQKGIGTPAFAGVTEAIGLSAETRRAAPAGLSPSTQELWLAALRYRRAADALAADAARKSA